MLWIKLPDVPLIVIVYVPAGVPRFPLRGVVWTSIDAAAPPFPGVTDGGEKEQVEADGNPEHDSDTD